MEHFTKNLETLQKLLTNDSELLPFADWLNEEMATL